MKMNLRHASDCRDRAVIENPIQVVGFFVGGIGGQDQSEFVFFHFSNFMNYSIHNMQLLARQVRTSYAQLLPLRDFRSLGGFTQNATGV
jgi:hypothetical protein